MTSFARIHMGDGSVYLFPFVHVSRMVFNKEKNNLEVIHNNGTTTAFSGAKNPERVFNDYAEWLEALDRN